MKKTYYHCAPFENLPGILGEGLVPGCEGIVYLTEDPRRSAMFVAIRGVKEILNVIVELDEEEVVETFDHSQAFFKCRCFGYPGTIPPEKLKFCKIEL